MVRNANSTRSRTRSAATRRAAGKLVPYIRPSAPGNKNNFQCAGCFQSVHALPRDLHAGGSSECMPCVLCRTSWCFDCAKDQQRCPNFSKECGKHGAMVTNSSGRGAERFPGGAQAEFVCCCCSVEHGAALQDAGFSTNPVERGAFGRRCGCDTFAAQGCRCQGTACGTFKPDWWYHADEHMTYVDANRGHDRDGLCANNDYGLSASGLASAACVPDPPAASVKAEAVLRYLRAVPGSAAPVPCGGCGMLCASAKPRRRKNGVRRRNTTGENEKKNCYGS